MITFLDNIVVVDRDFESYMVNISDVLFRFELYGMKLKLKNVNFFKVF